MDRDELTSAVKRAVLEFDAEAEIMLYGSRARGDAEPDSDWDFLILLRSAPDWRLKQRIRRQLYEIEWETGEVISSIFQSQQEWSSPLLQASPFQQNVSKEGVQV